jgi:hypothetical protein
MRLAFLLKLQQNLTLAGSEDLKVCCDGASLCLKTRRMSKATSGPGQGLQALT